MSNYRVHICLKLIEAVSLQVPMPNVEHYLERHIGGGDRPNKAEEKKLQEAMADISKRGLGHGQQIFVDICVSKTRKPNFKLGCCPCITASRGKRKGFWIVSRNRFTTLREKLWLTGLTEDEIPLDIVSKSQLGEMLGNAVPIPLMAAVLSAVLAAIS